MSVNNSDFRKFDVATVTIKVSTVPDRGAFHKDLIKAGNAYRQNIIDRAYRGLSHVVLSPDEYSIKDISINYNEKLDIAEYVVSFTNTNNTI